MKTSTVSLLFILLWGNLLQAQPLEPMKEKIQLGDSTILIRSKVNAADTSLIFLNVHEDEQTSIKALKQYSQVEPMRYFYLSHNQTRRVNFAYKGEAYSVDPNRIFTGKGRKKTLKDGGNYSRKAKQITKKLAQSILERIQGYGVVIAVHNNTDVNYSIKSYLEGGGEAQNTDKVYTNPSMDPDDFIYTTDKRFYKAFKALSVNVILQDNKRYVNDGSLSVYCGKREIPYINIETQKGHLKEQLYLIETTLKVIRSVVK